MKEERTMNGPEKFSLCQLAVPDATFEEDIALAVELGIGLGLDANKLGDPADDDRLIALMRDSGVPATVCVPDPMTILPAPLVPGSDDPRERLRSMTDGLRRLARFEPATVFAITGPQGSLSASEARELAVEGIRELQGVAQELGVVLSLEPMREENRATWTFLCSMAETVEFIEEVGGEIGIVYDMWHMWNTPDVLPMTERYGAMVKGVHVCDHREPTRSPMDRVLPGDGTIDMPSMIGALERGGFTGWWDLEIFSDDGRAGDDFPDSIWKRPTSEWVREGKEKFDRIYASTRAVETT
jgi:sugar phosphate isomerase/epimerase